jgi:hypothetical protein
MCPQVAHKDAGRTEPSHSTAPSIRQIGRTERHTTRHGECSTPLETRAHDVPFSDG